MHGVCLGIRAFTVEAMSRDLLSTVCEAWEEQLEGLQASRHPSAGRIAFGIPRNWPK